MTRGWSEFQNRLNVSFKISKEDTKKHFVMAGRESSHVFFFLSVHVWILHHSLVCLAPSDQLQTFELLLYKSIRRCSNCVYWYALLMAYWANAFSRISRTERKKNVNGLSLVPSLVRGVSEPPTWLQSFRVIWIINRRNNSLQTSIPPARATDW